MKKFSVPILLLLTVLMGSNGAVQAAATTYTVNSTNDVDDGTCDATHCSLREAINIANTNTGTDTIAFNIPGAGPHTIQLALVLPKITEPVIIDGYTQPGASLNTNGAGLGSNAVLKIELDGTNAGATGTGLNLLAGNCTVRGLVINRFLNGGIVVGENGGNDIEGNFIGTDVTGTAPAANSIGVAIDTDNNTIGGTLAGARNVISGNNFDGVVIFQGATGNVVHGNLIGTDASGTADLGNRIGVRVDGTGNTVGGTVAGARNVISDNDTSGVEIRTGNAVQGNFIGTDAAGTNPLGNAVHGVFVPAITFGNAIGGTSSDAGNVIAFNGADGVFVEAGTGNAILSNSIFSNAGLGIDLSPNGVSPNDAGDTDSGANSLQNFAVLNAATITAFGSITISGTLNSSSSADFRVEFFSNSVCDPSGYGEGETYLGFVTSTTDGSGDAAFTESISASVSPSHSITATATDTQGNTSEFSACVQAVLAEGVPGVTGFGLAVAAGLLAAALAWTTRRRSRRLAI